MFRPFSFYVGLRYTGARARNGFISVITLISALGLMLGVAVLITVLSVMNGFDHELQTRVLGMVTHLTVAGQEPVKDWQDLAKKVEANPNVEAVAPYSQLQGMLTSGGRVTPAVVTGIKPAAEKKVSIVGAYMDRGKLASLTPGSFNIILGYDMAHKLGVTLGDKVTLVMPEASLSPAGVMPRFKRFTVSGIFRVRAQVDGLFAYINIGDAGRLLHHPNAVEGVRARLYDLFKAPQVSWALQSRLGPAYYTSNWTRTQGSLFQAIKMEKTMMTLLLSFIVAVAAFNIISSQVMLVTEKRANIAVMRTLGATPGTIMRIFMVQGMLVGLVGTAVGLLLGVGVATHISEIGAWLQSNVDPNLFDAYFVNYLPSRLEWPDVWHISLLAVLLTFLATLYPSWRASRVEPAEALRYE